MKVSIFLCFFQDSFPFLHWTFNIPFYFLHPFTHNTVPNIPFYHPVFHTTPKQLTKRGNKKETRDLQDGGRVRLRDHLSPHKYIRNTSTCGTIPTEHLLNAGRRPQNITRHLRIPQTPQNTKTLQDTTEHWDTTEYHRMPQSTRHDKTPLDTTEHDRTPWNTKEHHGTSQNTAPLTEHFVHTRDCSKCPQKIISFPPLNSHMRPVLLSSFCSWENWNSENLTNLKKVDT